MTGIRAFEGRRRPMLLLLGAAASALFAIFWSQSGEAAPEDTSTVAVTRGNLVVTVGGVGRIVQSRALAEISLPANSVARSAGAGSAPVDAVFPRSIGRVAKFLVAPGQRVTAGQPLAILDDGGVAAQAVRQANLDLATALLELDQRRTSDPLRGLPPRPAELDAGHAAVAAAQARLARLQSPPRRADVSAARLDIKRAEADLETLRGGGPAARAASIRSAEGNVQLAQSRLDRILQPASPADLKLAEADVKRAEAELAVLRRPQLTPSPEALAAAQLAINNARSDLARALRTSDLEQIREAQSTLDDALNEMNLLLRPGPAALPQQIAAAETAVESARAKLERLQAPPNAADVAGARAELERARAELTLRKATPGLASVAAAQQAIASARTRLDQLLGPPLPADVRAARFELRRAQADLAVLQARGGPASATDIALSNLKVDSARLRLSGARLARNLLTVRAPWAGTVTSLLSVPGAPVDTTTPVASVADLSRLSASVDLSEFDAAMVRRGLKASVSVDALGGKSFPGVVQFASPTGTNAGGVVIFPVRVGLERAGGLKPGMNVSVRIFVAQRHNVLQLPLEAVARDSDDRAIVTLVDEQGETSTRRVKLGLANNQFVQILAGLRAGERVELPEQPTEESADEDPEA